MSTSIAVAPSYSKIISAYAKNGYALFKCNLMPDGTKVPIQGWRETENDILITPEELGDTFGINLGPDDLVLDYDPRRDAPGQNQLKEFMAKLGISHLETFIVKSGGVYFDKDGNKRPSGFHIYLKKPPGIKLTSRVPGFDAIELKTEGTFILGAGSVHNSGKFYTIYRGDLNNVLQCPKEILEYAEKALNYDEDGDSIESDDEATIQRFIRFCLHCDPAIEGEGGDERTLSVAREGYDYGLSEEAIYNVMLDNFNPRCQPEWDPLDLRVKVSNGFMYAKGVQGSKNPLNSFKEIEVAPKPKANSEQDKVRWDINKDGSMKANMLNLTNYFLIQPPDLVNPLLELVRYNEFSRTIEFTKPAPWHKKGDKKRWEDSDTLHLKNRLSRLNMSHFPTNLIAEGVMVEAQRHSYHPVKDYLESLNWDGKNRLDTFLSTYVGCEQNEYTKEVGKATLVGAVARIFEPGCDHHSMLILEGPQGNLKTTFIKTLGGQYYAEIPIDTRNKDTIQNMQGAWILEAAELEFMKGEELRAVRAFLTRATDEIRLPYERFTSQLPRQSIFMGTVNPDDTGEYLMDTTGNRRYWPVQTTTIDIKQLKKDRDQIFAEAVSVYKAGGFNYLVSEEVVALAKKEQDARTVKEEWTDIIDDWLKRMSKMRPEYLRTYDIASGALDIPAISLNKTVSNRISRAMKMLGYVRRQKRDGFDRLWYWIKDNLNDI